jgi:hypothetical protein
MTANGSDQPIFVDPAENVVTIAGNATQVIAADGTISPRTGPSGQVYAGVVNGATASTTLTPEAYNGQPYYSFNLNNLDIGVAPAPPPTTPTPPASPAPSPPPPVSSSPPPAPADPPAGGVVTTGTTAQADLLAMQPLIITAARRIPRVAPVATFTDANLSTTAVSFAAIIRWGDGSVSRGTISGGAGAFTVVGRHTYSRAGHFVIRVAVTMSPPLEAHPSTTSTAVVGGPLKLRRNAHARIGRFRGKLNRLA